MNDYPMTCRKYSHGSSRSTSNKIGPTSVLVDVVAEANIVDGAAAITNLLALTVYTRGR